MRKYLLSAIIISQLSSCVQYYSEEEKNEAINICACMENRQASRRTDIPKEVQFIYDDEDYKECILDALINGVELKTKEFSKAIEDQCPLLINAHKRYTETL